MSIKALNPVDGNLNNTTTITLVSALDSPEIALSHASGVAETSPHLLAGANFSPHYESGHGPMTPDSGGPPSHFGVTITAEQSGEVKLRNLTPADIPELKELCSQWFPIEYPNFWYQDITSNKKFCSLVATHQSRIIGLIVADVKLKMSIDEEDWYILSRRFPENTQLMYILSLGVLTEYRRLGIASLLLDTLIHHMNLQTNCKAVYLHVLASNAGAIRFYEKRGFQRRAHLHRYYTINGQAQDGYTYVHYVNGGEPTLLLADLVSKSWSKLKTLCDCNLACRFYTYLVEFFRHNHSLNGSRTKDQYRIS